MSNQWISVKDNLPNVDGVCIVVVASTSQYIDEPEVTFAFFVDGNFIHTEQYNVFEGRYQITYWQPMPQLPNLDDNN